MEIINSHEPIDEATISQFEKEYDVRIPDAYRTFLLKHNGGYPIPNAFDIDSREKDWIAGFMGIHNRNYTNLRSTLSSAPWIKEEGYLPIAEIPSGDMLVLGLNGEKSGKVYLWLHEELLENSFQYITESFESLLTNIHDYDERKEHTYSDETLTSLLKQYPLIAPKIYKLPTSTHHAYLVRAQQNLYLMRVTDSNGDKAKSLRNEAQFLDEISIDLLNEVPHLIVASNGNLRAETEQTVCLLTEWMQGYTLPLSELTQADAALLGSSLARWHLHTLVAQSTDEIENLFRIDSPYPLPSLLSKLTDEQQATIQKAMRVIENDLRAGKTSALLHGDFLLQNILLDGDKVRMIDLEYSRMGNPMYDLAPLLWQVRVRKNWSELQAAYLRGYSQERPLLEAEHAQIESFVVARHVASLHWLTHNPDNSHIYPKKEERLAYRIQELNGFLETGILKRT